jgi:DNA-binding MarR family transcriptional regulator
MAAAAPEALSEDDVDLRGLSGKVGYLLRRAQIAVFAEFIEVLRELRLRPGQFAVLRLVGSNPGLTQSKVCSVLGIKRANLVTVIDELARRGLVTRAASDTDRRSNRLQLTEDGRTVLDHATQLQERHEALIGRRLGAGGYADLLRLLAKLVD